MEIIERKQRSDEIDLKHSTVATGVNPVGMRTRVKTGNTRETIRIEENDHLQDNKTSFFSFWTSIGKAQDKEMAKASASSSTMYYEEEEDEGTIENSEIYLAQNKERTPLDLEDRPSGLTEASTIKVILDMSVLWKISLLRVDYLKCLIGCNRCNFSISVKVSGQWKA